MLASMQAGLAFSNASVTLIHGMSRPLGALFHVRYTSESRKPLAVARCTTPHGLYSRILLRVYCIARFRTA